MKLFALLVPLLAVAIALPPAARSQRVYSPLTHVLEIGGKRAVLAGDIQRIDSTGTLLTYAAKLSVASVPPILSEFFSSKSPSPQSGRVYGLAADGAVRTLRSFANVLFTEVQFPVLDALSNSTGFVNVRFEAEAAKNEKAPLRIEIQAPEDWPSSNFLVQIGDLPSRGVLKVEALTVRRTTPTRTGAMRTQQTSSQMEISNLNLTIDMRDWDKWRDWFDAYVLSDVAVGVAGGTIEFISADLRTSLSGYDVKNVAPVKLGISPMAANKEEIASFTVELLVGSVQPR